MSSLKYLMLFLLASRMIIGCSTGAGTSPTDSSPLETTTPAPTVTSTPLPTHTSTPIPTPTSTPVLLIGAGDIAYCGEEALGDEATADIIARFPSAAVFTAGDNVQDDGRTAEYKNCFDPTWGRFLDRLHPSPGNHDYNTGNGAPYFAYFGSAAGQAGQGWYSYELGAWHFVSLNSNCDNVACGPDSAQAKWLEEDLASSDKECTLLYWHHPRFTSGLSGDYGLASTFWKIALAHGADVVINGHDHSYERLVPQDGDGKADPQGIRQFIVGTGGAPLRFFAEPKPASEVRDFSTLGVILFKLYPGWYEWEFIPVEGGTFSDKGQGVCVK